MNRFTKISSTGKDLADTAKKWVAVRDNNSGLIWAAGSIAVPNYAAAEKAPASLKLLKQKDWRLPTVEELFLLADRTRKSPAIDTAFFPDTKNDWYWSSSAYAGNPDFAWFVRFDDGLSLILHRDFDGFVRAVRGPVLAEAGK